MYVEKIQHLHSSHPSPSLSSFLNLNSPKMATSTPSQDAQPQCPEPSSSLEQETNHTNGTTHAPPATAHPRSSYISQITVPLKNVPAFTPTKKLRVAIIGAGFSGMTMAHKLQYKYAEEFSGVIDWKIYEARSTVGGTWDANTYRKLDTYQ
jgi:hypothetical protein